VKINATARPHLNEIESSIIDIFIRATKMLGYPKSIGEIYGLLFVSESPLCMEDIMNKLGISLGAASQGLRILKSLRAVKTNHLIGQRREYFSADTEIDRFIGRYLKEAFSSHLHQWKLHQDAIRSQLEEGTSPNNAHLNQRMQSLDHLYEKSRLMLSSLEDTFTINNETA